jgi:hypothetical protein
MRLIKIRNTKLFFLQTPKMSKGKEIKGKKESTDP